MTRALAQQVSLSRRHADRKPTGDLAVKTGDEELEPTSAIGNVSISSTIGARVSETLDLNDVPDTEEDALEEIMRLLQRSRRGGQIGRCHRRQVGSMFAFYPVSYCNC